MSCQVSRVPVHLMHPQHSVSCASCQSISGALFYANVCQHGWQTIVVPSRPRKCRMSVVLPPLFFFFIEQSAIHFAAGFAVLNVPRLFCLYPLPGIDELGLSFSQSAVRSNQDVSFLIYAAGYGWLLLPFMPPIISGLPFPLKCILSRHFPLPPPPPSCALTALSDRVHLEPFGSQMSVLQRDLLLSRILLSQWSTLPHGIQRWSNRAHRKSS